MNSPPFNPLKDRTSRPGVGGGLQNDTTKRHAAAGSDACRWYFGDSKCPATAAWRWRTTCGSTCRPAGRTAFRTGAAHGSAADVRAADVGAAHVSAANGAKNGTSYGTAAHAASSPDGDTARQYATHWQRHAYSSRRSTGLSSVSNSVRSARCVNRRNRRRRHGRKHVQMCRRRRNSSFRPIRRPTHVTSCARHVTSCVPSVHCVETRPANCAGFHPRSARRSASSSTRHANSVHSPGSSSRSRTPRRQTRMGATGVRIAETAWRA